MTLAHYLAFYKDELICDLAEQYNVFNWKGLPVETLATLSCGLRVNSRIHQKMNNLQVPFNTFLLANVLDKLNILIWQKTKDGAKNRNRPVSLADIFSNRVKTSEIEGFESIDDFKAAMKRFEVKQWN